VRRLAAVALPLLLLAGCGGSATLTEGQGHTLESAREGLDDAIDTAEVLRTDKAEARKLVREVERLRKADTGKKLAEVVPSLVGEHDRIDKPAVTAFVRNATSSPANALLLPAARHVDRMVTTLEGKDTTTKIALLGGQTASAYLSEAERDTKPIWPALAKILRQSREELSS
jgi:hypothetical protein